MVFNCFHLKHSRSLLCVHCSIGQLWCFEFDNPRCYGYRVLGASQSARCRVQHHVARLASKIRSELPHEVWTLHARAHSLASLARLAAEALEPYTKLGDDFLPFLLDLRPLMFHRMMGITALTQIQRSFHMALAT